MRTFTIANKDIRKELTERGKWVAKGRKLDAELRKMKEEYDAKMIELNKCALQIDKIKDKLTPLIERYVKPVAGLAEFEEVNSVQIKGAKLEVQVIDKLEEFKERHKEQMAKNLSATIEVK